MPVRQCFSRLQRQVASGSMTISAAMMAGRRPFMDSRGQAQHRLPVRVRTQTGSGSRRHSTDRPCTRRLFSEAQATWRSTAPFRVEWNRVRGDRGSASGGPTAAVGQRCRLQERMAQGRRKCRGPTRPAASAGPSLFPSSDSVAPPSIRLRRAGVLTIGSGPLHCRPAVCRENHPARTGFRGM